MRTAALSAAALGWVSPAVASEMIYKSVAGDGSVTYSQVPAAGARQATSIDVETLTPAQRRAALLLRSREEKADQALADSLARLDGPWRRADKEIHDANEALTHAEAALQAGRMPRTGERLGNVGGGTRLTEAYFRRLAELDDRVRMAKEQLDRAYEARNKLK
ncbi:MAG TPA: DUF4124 domain-containing protein [Usitatibacter sp.]